MILPLLMLMANAPADPPVAGLRASRVEIYQSGLIELDDEIVSLKDFARRLRAVSRRADILCVWREPKLPDGRPAYDPDQPAALKRLERDMRATGILAESARRLPSFEQGDAICQGNRPAGGDPR